MKKLALCMTITILVSAACAMRAEDWMVKKGDRPNTGVLGYLIPATNKFKSCLGQIYDLRALSMLVTAPASRGCPRSGHIDDALSADEPAVEGTPQATSPAAEAARREAKEQAEAIAAERAKVKAMSSPD